MSTEVGIWRIGAGKLVPISLKGLEYERHLQNIVADDVSVIGPRLTVIGREVETPVGSRIDILAIDSDGNLTIIELKRDRTPREVVAQILDYGSWIRRLTAEDIGRTYIDYQDRFLDKPTPLGIDDALIAAFGSAPEQLNSSHQLIIVAAEVDPATERIVAYLQEEYGVNISVVLFRAFEDEERQYLTRVWMDERDPFSGEAATSDTARRDWNGECYVSFGEGGSRRRWRDAKQFGFISAGGGKFYVQTLKSLKPGDRVWVKICELPKNNGYVGVGRVRTEATRFDSFVVDVDGSDVPIADAGIDAHFEFGEGEEEYYVGVEWERAVDLDEAVWQRGFFANQNTVARPRDPKWAFTIDFLKRTWKID